MEHLELIHPSGWSFLLSMNIEIIVLILWKTISNVAAKCRKVVLEEFMILVFKKQEEKKMSDKVNDRIKLLETVKKKQKEGFTHIETN